MLGLVSPLLIYGCLMQNGILFQLERAIHSGGMASNLCLSIAIGSRAPFFNIKMDVPSQSRGSCPMLPGTQTLVLSVWPGEQEIIKWCRKGKLSQMNGGLPARSPIGVHTCAPYCTWAARRRPHIPVSVRNARSNRMGVSGSWAHRASPPGRSGFLRWNEEVRAAVGSGEACSVCERIQTRGYLFAHHHGRSPSAHTIRDWPQCRRNTMSTSYSDSQPRPLAPGASGRRV